MGAFYISPGENVISKEVLNLFSRNGFSEPLETNTRGFKALFFPKQNVRSINRIQLNDITLYITGTCFVKGKSYSEGLNWLIKSYSDGKFDPATIAGSYFILFEKGDEAEFYSDPASTQNIFLHRGSGIISSSFLACLLGASAAGGRLLLNKMACTEILITGNLTGPDTIVNEIERYEPALNNYLPGLKRIPVNLPLTGIPSGSSFSQQVEQQLEILRDYFKGIVPVISEFGVMSGLTGGFDSRLIFLLLNGLSDNFDIYSTFRPGPNIELECAKKITDRFNHELHSPGYRRFDNMDSDSFISLMKENLYFNDGQIRTHQLWTEEIKSRKYLISLQDQHKIGMSGVGGEQYRNGEFLVKERYLFDEWYFFEMIFRHCGDPFNGEKQKREWLRYIRAKISRLLDEDFNSGMISRFYIKRYLNEVYNPANRTLRNNIENQAYFFLSPFTDYFVSRSAYRAFSLLGAHHEFQKEMIRILAPEAADIKMDYGYAINEKVPLKYRLIPQIKKYSGLANYFRVNNLLRGDGSLAEKMVGNHNELESFIAIVNDLRLPVSTDSLIRSDHLFPMVPELGLFVKEFQNHLTID